MFARKDMGNDIYKKLLKLNAGKKRIHYIDGDTKTEIREEVREICERDGLNIIVASIQVFGTGINIKNLHNIIIAHPGKGRIRLLQAIGRGLRIHASKDILRVFDIVDNFTYTGHDGRKENYSIQHYRKRKAIYKQEQFEFNEKRIQL